MCLECPSYCKKCTYDATNSKTMCTSGECETGYAHEFSNGADTGKCVQCPTKCNACTGSAAGVKCDDTKCDVKTAKNAQGLCEGMMVQCFVLFSQIMELTINC